MTLQTFTPPIPPSSVRSRPEVKVLSASFGDGYTQKAGDGLNNIRKVFALEWEVLTPAQADAIVSFLEARKGYLPFLYDVSGSNKIQFDCQEWEDNTGRAGLRSVSATFKQSFVLVS